MRILTIIFLLTILSNLANSQNIYSALQLNQNREYKTKKPKKIVETNTFYNTSGTQVDKNVKTFDEAGMLLIEERYNESGSLKARLIYTNDTINRLKLTRSFERWNQFGFSKETAFYNYDTNHFLTSTTDKDANGNILRQSDLVCNDKGHPIQLSLFDGNGNSFGKEIATYLYDINKVVTSVVSNDGRTLSSDTIKISFKTTSSFPNDRETYNANGDLVNWTSRNFKGEETIYEEEYSYDSFGNCIESRIYKVIIKRNGNKKRDIDRIFKKGFTY
jgi:hypothetical protein